eukprot:2768263-Pleurochrysis_carterae.AAC.1
MISIGIGERTSICIGATPRACRIKSGTCAVSCAWRGVGAERVVRDGGDEAVELCRHRADGVEHALRRASIVARALADWRCGASWAGPCGNERMECRGQGKERECWREGARGR